jgi:hypothetical protein
MVEMKAQEFMRNYINEIIKNYYLLLFVINFGTWR